MRSRIIYSLFVLCFCAAVGRSQTRQIRSIVVKVKDSRSIASPSAALARIIHRASPLNLSAAPRILPTTGKTNIQSTTYTASGLDRIVVLPLQDSISAETACALFKGLNEIEYAEPNYIYHIDRITAPNDSLYSGQWAHAAMDVLGAWQVTQGDSTIHIGFVDTGVEWDHPDLVGQFAVNPAEDINHNGLFDPWPSTEQHPDAYGNMVYGDLDGIDEDGNGYVDDVIGYDFVDQSSINFGDASVRDPIPQDEESHRHGTAVAGVIAAKANNKIGVAGIAPKCRLVALRAFDATGNAEDDDIASAIVYAADNGVRILNLSFGDIVRSNLQRDAIRYATAKGVLVVASSGNDGGNQPHYPSDFDECLSVGMTALDANNREVLNSQTTHGYGMDLVAPGTNILTTADAGTYQSISGTSFSSPATAAVAGLILASHPGMSNLELRSVLEETADYINSSDYNFNYANGRVNAATAVTFHGSANITITDPHTEDPIAIDSVITITGSAASTLFQSYSLALESNIQINPSLPTYSPNDSILISSNDQVLDGTLGVWNTKGYAPGTYAIKLTVHTSDFHDVEQWSVVTLHSRTPYLQTLTIDSIYNNEKRALLVLTRTDSLTSATLYYRSHNNNIWSTANDDRYGHGHFFLLTTDNVAAGVAIDLMLVTRDGIGDSVISLGASVLPTGAFPQTGFSQKSYSLPGGYVLDTMLQSTSGPIVIENVSTAGSDYGTLAAFRFNALKHRFDKIDSLGLYAIPRSIGNIDLNGPSEVLLQGASSSIYLYKPNASHAVFGDLVFADTTTGTMLPVLLADVDHDGRSELVGRTLSSVGGIILEGFEVDRIANGSRNILGTLVNNTPPAPQFQTNSYNTPDARSADFVGQGDQDIAVIDDDADLLLWEFSPDSLSKFRTVYTDLNNGYTEGRNIAVGDFNGDGKPDIAIAYHTSYDPNLDNEYDASYWTVRVLINTGNGSFEQIYLDHFYLARSLSPYRSSLGSIHNVTGGNTDDLVLSLFPNFYLLEYDAGSATMKPVWQYPLSNSARGAITYDFDGNGKREFGFTAGDSVLFFERDNDLLERTQSPASFNAIPRDSNRADLSWSAVDGATEYYILRATAGPNAKYDVIDSTNLSLYSDTTVTDLTDYIYSVQAFDQTKNTPLSEPAFGIETFIHPMPKIKSIFASGMSLTVHTTQPIQTAALQGGEFTVDDSSVASTAIVASDSVIIVTLSNLPTPSVTHTLRINSFSLRDAWNSPFDTTTASPWTASAAPPSVRFYIRSWSFEGSGTIHVVFSLPPDDNALNATNYTLTPFGKLLSAARDLTNDSAVNITLTPGTVFDPIGASYILCANNITSGGIPLEETTSCVGETPVAGSLDHVFVYPNPAKPSDDAITFAGLTAHADVTIYTQDMRFLRRLTTTSFTGGVVWDLRDDAGKVVPSGVYLYHIDGTDQNGVAVKPANAKFVVVRDE